MGTRTTADGASFGGPRRASLLAAATAALAVLLAPTASAAAAPTSLVAQPLRSVAVYRLPGAKRPFVRFSRLTPAGEERAFLVAQRLPGWDRVYLPMRPNGVTGWVRERDVKLAVDPYSVVVSLRRHEVAVFRAGRLVLRTKAGVGRSVLPTPHGTYFLVELLKQPDPQGPYGPYAFGLSAFSNVLYRFGAGPGEIGLHGTDYPAGIGTDISHGCIRLTNATISRLAHLLPLGTPVTIED